VTDGAGNSAFLQLVAVANGAIVQNNQSSSSSGSTKVVVLYWPLYVAFVLIILSFWLGGRSRMLSERRQAERRL